MSQNQDSTHSRNLNTVFSANEVGKGLGARYQPARDLIKPPVIDAYLTDCEASLTAAHNAEMNFNTASDARSELFEGSDKFATRVVKALESCGAPDAAVEDAKALARKLRGERVEQQEPAGSDAPAEDIQEQISVAQLSYDSRLANFRKLSELLAHHAAHYTPNEPELKLDAINDRLDAMTDAHRAVSAAAAAYGTALIARDRLLYNEETGLVARMDAIRTYFESAFGTNSPERKLLVGLKVRTLRSKRLAGA